MAITKEHVEAVNAAREALAIEKYNKRMKEGWGSFQPITRHDTDYTVDSAGNCEVVPINYKWPEPYETIYQRHVADTVDKHSLPAERKRILQTSSEERKKYPMARGLMDYFPDALAEVAKVSYLGNQKHNPGEPMHHARSKSTDHADCIVRHLIGRGGFDGDTRESAALVWRALALLQEELEAEYNLSLPRGAKA